MNTLTLAILGVLFVLIIGYGTFNKDPKLETKNDISSKEPEELRYVQSVDPGTDDAFTYKPYKVFERLKEINRSDYLLGKISEEEYLRLDAGIEQDIFNLIEKKIGKLEDHLEIENE